MAQEQEHPPKGRMLFTDFDASDKLRPNGGEVRDQSAPGKGEAYRRPALLSIEQLASSLDLDFEDDWDVAPDPADAAPDRAEAEHPRPAPREPHTTAPSPLAADRPTATAPTWEEFTSLFTAPHENALVVDSTIPVPPAAPTDPADEDAEMDILSLLSIADADGLAATENETEPWRGQRLGVPPPRQTPYAGLTRLEEWYTPPEPGADETAAEPFDIESAGPGGVTAIIPRPQADPSATDTDIMEMPDAIKAISAEAVDRAKREESARWREPQADLFDGLNLESLWEEKLRQARDRAKPPAADTRYLDVFADIDLDAAWEKRRHSARRKQDSSPPSDTASSREATEKEATVFFDSGDYPELAAAALPPAPAHSSEVKRGRAADGTESPPKKPKRKTRRKHPPPSRLDDDAIGFLDDLEIYTEEADGTPTDEKTEAGETASPDDVRTKRRKHKRRAPRSLEELDIEDLVSLSETDTDDGEEPDYTETADSPIPASNNSAPSGLSPEDFLANLGIDDSVPAVNPNVSAPVIDDSAISSLYRQSKKAARAEPDGGAEELPLPDERDRKESGKDGAPAEAGTDAGAEESGEREAEEDLSVLDALGVAHEEASSEDDDENGQAKAVDPLDVFANMTDMDFSGDGLDDEMKAMLDEDAAEAESTAGEEISDDGEASPTIEKLPRTFKGRLLHAVRGVVAKVAPAGLLQRLRQALAWRENWWFYCDLVALIIASGSLGIILSYFLWYRN